MLIKKPRRKSDYKLLALFSGLVLSLYPFFATAAAGGLVTCSGTSDDPCQFCKLLGLAENIINILIVGLGIPASMLLFAYAGFLYVTYAASPSNLDKAKNIFVSTLLGFIFMIASWLVVDTIMKNLTDQGSNKFGPWHQIECVVQPQPGVIVNFSGLPIQTGTYTGATGGGEQCKVENTSCNVDALQAVGYTQAQANAMSCIAMTESSGNPNEINPNGGACGTFQVVPGNWKRLSSQIGCAGQSCTNADCNLRAARALSVARQAKGQSIYSDWTCPGCNARAQGCVTKYDPGN